MCSVCGKLRNYSTYNTSKNIECWEGRPALCSLCTQCSGAACCHLGITSPSFAWIPDTSPCLDPQQLGPETGFLPDHFRLGISLTEMYVSGMVLDLLQDIYMGACIQTQLLGVLLAAASNFLISVSLNIQKCAHLQLACQTETKPYYMSKLWWCGITFLGLGEVGNFTAYGFAPIDLVAPLGCVSVIGSAFISVLFLKKTMRAADILGGTLTVTGTYLLVTFAPNVPQDLTARRVQNYLVSWPFLVYSILEIIIFCILLYFYKRKAVKHIVVLLMMVALLASLTVIAVKAVASMITLSAKGKMQLTYPVFYIMVVLMATSCVFQVKFLNQAVHLYEATAVVPINFVFFTTSAIISGVVFYQEFQNAALLSMFMFLFGCLLSFLGVFVIARNKKGEHLQIPFIDCGHIPGQKLTSEIQPDSHSSHYGTLNNEDDSVKSQT